MRLSPGLVLPGVLLAATASLADTPPPSGPCGRTILLCNTTGSAFELKSAPEGISWADAAAAARELGGHLATPSDSVEARLVASLAAGCLAAWTVDAHRDGIGPWIGARPHAGAGGLEWEWIDGSPLSFTPPAPFPPPTDINEGLVLRGVGRLTGDDWTPVPATDLRYGFVVEWDDGRAVAPVHVVRSVTVAPGAGSLPEYVPLALFGSSMAQIGDLDGDGVQEMVAGIPARSPDRGEVRILWVDGNGVPYRSRRLVPDGGEIPFREPGSQFGISVAPLGDLDEDGVPDLAVGMRRSHVMGTSHGEVLILFLRRDGSVRETRSILPLESTENFPVVPQPFWFGVTVSACGSIDGNGGPVLVVGSNAQSRGGYERGMISLLHIRRDGTLERGHNISSIDGGFRGRLEDGDRFGAASWIGDVDGDGVQDLAVGAVWDDHPFTNAGALWILFLNADGTVRDHVKIAAGLAGLAAESAPFAYFGLRVTPLDDLDGDGIAELAVAAGQFPEGGGRTGVVWILFLRRDGTVRMATRLGALAGGFADPPRAGDFFGHGVASVELDGQPPRELIVGSSRDDTGCEDCGAYRVLFFGTPDTALGGR
ncbi:FG-GAP-like repeat-containing protein [bacterium]|nr:FG-GAP-like repeat-containing protein [bacterium]